MSTRTSTENAAAAVAATIAAAAAAADPDWNREARRPTFVTIPLAVTEDMTLGTIDMDESVKRGQPVFLPGLLARAHRGGAACHVTKYELELCLTPRDFKASGFQPLTQSHCHIRYTRALSNYFLNNSDSRSIYTRTHTHTRRLASLSEATYPTGCCTWTSST